MPNMLASTLTPPVSKQNISKMKGFSIPYVL